MVLCIGNIGGAYIGLAPLQKKLRSGQMVTGGIWNNKRPLDNEDPKEYANPSVVQWHKVTVYVENLKNIVMKHVLHE